MLLGVSLVFSIFLLYISLIHCLGGGWAGTAFFMDPTAGVAFVFGVQVAPTRDIELFKVAIPLQNALYAGLKIVDWIMEVVYKLYSVCLSKVQKFKLRPGAEEYRLHTIGMPLWRFFGKPVMGLWQPLQAPASCFTFIEFLQSQNQSGQTNVTVHYSNHCLHCRLCRLGEKDWLSLVHTSALNLFQQLVWVRVNEAYPR